MLRIFVQSTHDQFGPVEELESIYQALPEPKQLLLVDAQDHFFAGALEKLEETIFLLG
jgi:alpha/beta superfamily hydrolase